MSPKRIVVGDVEVAYDEVGRGARPLVLVHGYTGFRRDFESQLPALAHLGWTLAPDLRGHGDSSHGDPTRYRLDQLAEDVRGFLGALGVERCDLLGHSMGGMVALRLALRAPDLIASLVLMDTAPARLEWIPLEPFRLARQVARAAGMKVLQQALRERADEDPLRTEADRQLEREWGPARYWERHRQRFHAMDPEAYAELGRELLEQESLVPRLREIRCPTLVMVGEQDRHLLSAAALLADRIPRARKCVIPEAGHQPQLENPSAWLAALREHLAEARAPERGRGLRA